MARFKTTPLREAIYFFYKPLLVLEEVSPRKLAGMVKIPEETLRSHTFWYRKKYGGREQAKVQATSFIAEHQQAFDEFHNQLAKVQASQVATMIYGLYWGYESAFIKFGGYKPGKWRNDFKRAQGFWPDGIFPYCGVVGLRRKEHRSNLVTVYQIS